MAPRKRGVDRLRVGLGTRWSTKAQGRASAQDVREFAKSAKASQKFGIQMTSRGKTTSVPAFMLLKQHQITSDQTRTKAKRTHAVVYHVTLGAESRPMKSKSMAASGGRECKSRRECV
eukprot:3319537-Rhodomonas_salina.1